MKSTKLFAWMFACTWILSTLFAGMPASRAALGNNTTLSQDFTLSFTKAWNDGSTNENDVTVPDVASVVDNITSYVKTGYTAYVGTQVPTKTLNRYLFRMNATHVYIYNNHDTTTEGDIYLRGEINQLVDDDMSDTMQWDIYLGSFPDGTHLPLSLTLFYGWAAYIAGRIELYDDDTGIVDSYGIWDFNWDYTYAGYEFNVTYSGGDAKVTYRIELLGGPVSMNAAALLDAYKPYLWEDMETSYHDPPVIVCGRVIEGYDSRYGKSTSCLQYIYAYDAEYSGTNVFVHYWDWEMVLIFVDLSGVGWSVYPYRLVWDNGFYFGSGTGRDWIDGQKYYIYEKNAVPGSYYMDVNFSTTLWPLLGKSRQMNYEVYDITALFDTSIENWGIFEWGLPSFQATIETSYHQFDIGDADGLGTTPILRGYPVHQLNNSILNTWYKCLNYSWTQGIHEVSSGDWTPLFAPFSWDVMQPFTRPYILNNYPQLCVDINGYNGAKEQKTFDVDVKKSINVTLQVPCTIDLTIPESGAPGDPVSTALNFHLHPEKANLTMDVFLNFSVQARLFFEDYSWQSVFDKQFFLDFNNPVLQVVGQLVKLTTDSTYTFSGVNLGSYITIGGAISPHLLGTILDLEVQVHIAEILKALLGPTYEWIVDLIADSLDLVINPQITGYLAMDVYGGGTQIGPRAQFTAEEQSLPVTFTLPDGSLSNFLLEIKNITYGIHFNMDWSITLVWGELPSLVLDDQEWQLGIWPNIDIDLAEGSAKLNSVARYGYNSGKGVWVLESAFGNPYETPPSNTWWILLVIIVPSVVLVGVVVPAYRRKHKGRPGETAIIAEIKETPSLGQDKVQGSSQGSVQEPVQGKIPLESPAREEPKTPPPPFPEPQREKPQVKSHDTMVPPREEQPAAVMTKEIFPSEHHEEGPALTEVGRALNPPEKKELPPLKTEELETLRQVVNERALVKHPAHTTPHVPPQSPLGSQEPAVVASETSKVPPVSRAEKVIPMVEIPPTLLGETFPEQVPARVTSPITKCPFCLEEIKDGKCTFCRAWVCRSCGQVSAPTEWKCKRCDTAKP